MCPSIECPACGKRSYHRGTCENCDFDPLSSRWEEPGPLSPQEFADAVDKCSGLVFAVRLKPFPFIRVSHSSYADLDEFAEITGYRGSIFETKSNPEDAFSKDMYGFDIVKDMCRPYLDMFVSARS